MLQLQTQKRDIFGKQVEKLRTEGLIPAEIYGHGKENVHVSVLAKDFNRTWKEAGENTIVEILLDGKKYPTLIYDVQRDPLKDIVLHVDFYEVRMDEKVKAKVPIRFAGEAPAVKAYGGVLVKSLEEIEVEALPVDLPQYISVDLSILAELNQSIYVRDIPAVDRVRFLADPETAVASITEQRVEVEEVVPPPSEVPTEGEVAVPVEGEQSSTEEKKE